MRQGRRIAATPAEYADMRRRECRRNAAEALQLLSRARARGDEWYVWVASGRPALTREQYAALETKRRPRARA